MKRNMELVRMILTKLENNPGDRAPRDFGILSSFPSQEIAYHAHIMMQEGLIEAVDTTMHRSGPEAPPTSLTWKGHEFLDLARDQDRWNRAKAIIAKVGGAPIAVWMKVLTDLMMQGVESAITKVR